MDGGGDAIGENSLSDSFFPGDRTMDGDVDEGDEGEQEEMPNNNSPLREQDRFLPIANVARIMKNSVPKSGKIAKDAKECVQECVSEFISFITSEASDRCAQEKRKTINGEDILYAMSTLGFDTYVEPLKQYLQKYRESMKGDKPMGAAEGEMSEMDPSHYDTMTSLGATIMDSSGQQNVIYATTAFSGGQGINFAGM